MMETPVSGTPRVLLRVEGFAALVAAILAYHTIGAPWMLFAVVLLVPDVALLAYVAGPRIGALAYNATHTYCGPACLAALAYFGVLPAAWPICLIWIAHIGMDRSLGLGLKFPSAFRNTHLSVVAAASPAVPLRVAGA